MGTYRQAISFPEASSRGETGTTARSALSSSEASAIGGGTEEN